MDFRVHGDKEPRWSIESEKDWFFSGWTKCTITKCMNQKLDGTFRERWRVAIEDLENRRTELPSRHKRMMKDVECGIAALVPEPGLKQRPIFTSSPVPKYFSTLPLSFPTDLPVHIHATFLLASDRASIPVEDSMQEDGAKWNRWLLSDAIPALYLHFLEDLGRETHLVQDPFEFWPQDSPPKRHLSKAAYTSFWKMLPDSSRKLFPVTRQIRAAKLGKRKPPELVKIDEAIFDFLPESKSSHLRDILELLIPTLVRPPGKVRCELQRDMVVESVTPKRLRELFKQGIASLCLENAVSENPTVLETLLEIIKPVLDEDFAELDGCRILPLADDTLGTLRLLNPLKRADNYFLADAEELKLFEFALGLLVSQEPGKAFKKIVMDCAKFNITRLNLSDIGILLERHDFGNRTPTTKEMDTWLGKFWDYCHKAESTRRDMKPFTSGWEICHHPIFVATCNGVRSYIEPEKLDMLPSVIEPGNPQQRSLCDKFPGIHVFSSGFLPSNIRTTEISFETRASFTRLITTVSKLARKEGVGLEAYINNHLGLTEKKVCSVLGAQAWMLSNGSPYQMLQELVVKYVSADTSIKEHDMRDLLKLLPVWPIQGCSSWISSKMANATENSGLLVPWMSGSHRFIEHRTFISNLSILRALGVHEVPGINLLSKNILPNLPRELPDVDGYRKFIRAIPQISNWRSCLNILRQSKLVPNRAKKLRAACELFDHEDIIFRSAFRNEQHDVFLLKEMEEYKWFWLELGLKHRVNGEFKPDDYILCLTRMRTRLKACKDQTIYAGSIADAQVVLAPLTTPSTALGRFSNLHWSYVADQATFPARVGLPSQSPHRRETMALIAAAMPLLQLSNIIGSQYMSVCWSQTSFPAFEPTVTTLAKIPSKGKPTTLMTWRHLQHLADSVEALAEDAVRAFLSDLYDTYDYLQDNWEDSKNSFTEFRGSQVWFNLEVTERGLVRKADLELCRCGIVNLILESSCDAKNLKSVRQGLIPYQRLLRALGCKSIVYPSVEQTETRSKPLLSTSLERLRREENLLDVTLQAIDGDIRAHKVVLAAASGYFAGNFKDYWSNNNTINLKPFLHSTLSVVVDFAYTDAFVWKNMQVQENDTENEIADKLDELLDLLEAANYFDMPDLLAQVEKQILIPAKIFIKEHNVLGVLKRASDARARQVEMYCTKFYAGNKEAVDLANEE